MSLIRLLLDRDPESIWNLMSMVRGMFKRKDTNGIILLEIITSEVLIGQLVCLFQYKILYSLVLNTYKRIMSDLTI